MATATEMSLNKRCNDKFKFYLELNAILTYSAKDGSDTKQETKLI